MSTKATLEAELSNEFKASVTRQVAKGGATRWGEVESVAVMEDLIALFTGSGEMMEEGTGLLVPFLRKVVNPSATAQALEKLPDGHPSKIKRPARGAGGGRAASAF